MPTSVKRKPLNLVFIEDSETDRVVYRRFLERDSEYEYAIVEFSTLAEGAAYCLTGNVDGVLLDYYLPDGEGIEFLTVVAERCQKFDFFTVMITGQGNEELAAQAIIVGATEYLPKRLVNEVTLCQVVRSAHKRLLLQRKIVEEQLEKDLLIEQLQSALADVRRLSALLPICCECKSIRNDQGYWQAVETYFSETTNTEFTHGICPDCMKRVFDLDTDSL